MTNTLLSRGPLPWHWHLLIGALALCTIAVGVAAYMLLDRTMTVVAQDPADLLPRDGTLSLLLAPSPSLTARLQSIFVFPAFLAQGAATDAARAVITLPDGSHDLIRMTASNTGALILHGSPQVLALLSRGIVTPLSADPDYLHLVKQRRSNAPFAFIRLSDIAIHHPALREAILPVSRIAVEEPEEGKVTIRFLHKHADVPHPLAMLPPDSGDGVHIAVSDATSLAPLLQDWIAPGTSLTCSLTVRRLLDEHLLGRQGWAALTGIDTDLLSVRIAEDALRQVQIVLRGRVTSPRSGEDIVQAILHTMNHDSDHVAVKSRQFDEQWSMRYIEWAAPPARTPQTVEESWHMERVERGGSPLFLLHRGREFILSNSQDLAKTIGALPLQLPPAPSPVFRMTVGSGSSPALAGCAESFLLSASPFTVQLTEAERGIWELTIGNPVAF